MTAVANLGVPRSGRTDTAAARTSIEHIFDDGLPDIRSKEAARWATRRRERGNALTGIGGGGSLSA